MNPAQQAKFQALLARATHESTPVEEARTSAMILARLIAASGGFPADGPNDAAEIARLRSDAETRMIVIAQLRADLDAAKSTIRMLDAENARLRSQSTAQAPTQNSATTAKWINVKFPCKCKKCGQILRAGQRAYWYGRGSGRVECCAAP